jgi:hypothetical protein
LRCPRRELIDAEFAGVLGMDAFPVWNSKQQHVKPDVLRRSGDQMHLDPAKLCVVEGFMAESREVEISIQLTIDPR